MFVSRWETRLGHIFGGSLAGMPGAPSIQDRSGLWPMLSFYQSSRFMLRMCSWPEAGRPRKRKRISPAGGRWENDTSAHWAPMRRAGPAGVRPRRIIIVYVFLVPGADPDTSLGNPEFDSERLQDGLTNQPSIEQGSGRDRHTAGIPTGVNRWHPAGHRIWCQSKARGCRSRWRRVTPDLEPHAQCFWATAWMIACVVPAIR